MSDRSNLFSFLLATLVLAAMPLYADANLRNADYERQAFAEDVVNQAAAAQGLSVEGPISVRRQLRKIPDSLIEIMLSIMAFNVSTTRYYVVEFETRDQLGLVAPGQLWLSEGYADSLRVSAANRMCETRKLGFAFWGDRHGRGKVYPYFFQIASHTLGWGSQLSSDCVIANLKLR